MFGVGRFADIQNEIGIPKSVLSARLKSMVENGLAEKQPYRDGTARTRLAYVLTRKGRGLVPVLLALMQWGDVHLKGGESTLEPTDRRYGHALKIGIAPPDKTLPIRRLKILPDNAAGG